MRRLFFPAFLSVSLASLLAAAPTPAAPTGGTLNPPQNLVPGTVPSRAATASRPALLVEDPTKPSPVRSNAAGATNNGWINTHNQLVTKAKAGNIDLYMEGDSITDFWQKRFAANWNKNLGPWKPGDFGISGDRTQNLLYRIANGELDGVNPKVIVLMIGTNNLAFNATYGMNSVEDTVKGVKAVIDALREKAPKAKILLIAIMPRNDSGKTPPAAEMWQDINKTNEAIAKFADDKTIKFLNFNDKLADKDGKLFPGIMGGDNLHPADKGYQIWADAMKPILTEWLGAPAPASAPAP
ncbi:MAG TPA: GDSL-type esterase/lipase family protein [Phycisphaerae bacterium]